MNYKLIYRMFATAVFVLVTAGLSLGHDVKIEYQTKLGNGPEIEPGTYRLELVRNQDAAEAAFYQGKVLVASVPVTVEMESKKSPHTAVHYETLDSGRVINKIRVMGWKESLIFRVPSQSPVTTDR